MKKTNQRKKDSLHFPQIIMPKPEGGQRKTRLVLMAGILIFMGMCLGIQLQLIWWIQQIRNTGQVMNHHFYDILMF